MAFRDWSAPLSQVFSGNACFLLCSLFYLGWWLLRFRPGAPAGRGVTGALLGLAFASGVAALFLLASGVRAVSASGGGVSVLVVVLGGIGLYVVLLLVTTLLFHRQVTSELLIMLIWMTAEFCALTALNGAGRFGAAWTAVGTALVAAATVVGIVSYVLFYRLGGRAGYWDGAVPLLTDSGVLIVLLGLLAFS